MFNDRMTVAEARTQLNRVIKDGHECPVCSQFAKVYDRGINSTMTRALITMWREAGYDFVHAPSLPGDTHEISQFAWWGFVEDEKARRPDGGKAGVWRITPKGVEWVQDRSCVPHKALIYDSELLGFAGDHISVKDALGKKFSYNELMNT